MKLLLLKWFIGWAKLIESIISIATFGFVSLEWGLYMAKQYSKYSFYLTSRSSRVAEACRCGRKPIALRCNTCGGLVPVKQPPPA